MYSQINNEIYKLKEELRAKEKLQSLRIWQMENCVGKS